ncbi:MAG: HAD-IA family hydrolase [Leadbetterella sp.]|nr:HAD-IA family hydrolase [Leadbetterella sp.]
MRRTRFRNTLLAVDVPCTEEESLAMNEEFMRLLPIQKHLMEGALEVLEYLRPKYRLHIISNGFLDIQTRKMTESGILSYFEHIITSDISGAKKPDKKIFDYALKSTGALPGRSVYIGDDEIADKAGSQNAGLPYIHYDPNEITPSRGVICKLTELKALL